MTTELHDRTEGTRILILDDDGFDCRKLAAELRGLGCDVAVQSCPETAPANHAGVDFAILNPMLGGRSWHRFLHSIHAALPERWTVLAESPSTALIAESMKLGACTVVSKPISGAELLLIWRDTFIPSPLPGRADLSLARVEWEHMHKVIRLCNGNMTAAARQLDIPRQTLYNRIRKAPHFTRP